MSAPHGYDALIVGAGPAGMAAATVLAESGARVCVVDDQPGPGGQIWRGRESGRSDRMLAALGDDYQAGAASIARFRASGAEYRPLTQMWQIEPGWRVFTKRDGRASFSEARAVLLATGAQERPVPFAGWTLPGVMTVGGAQILLKTSAQVPQGPVWIAGSGPLPLLYMTQLVELGGEIAGYIDTSPRMSVEALARLPGALRGWRDMRKGLGWLARLRRAGVPVHRGARDLQAIGDDRLREIRFCTRSGEQIVSRASNLLVHEGVVPQVHATMALNCEHDWSEPQGCFVPRTDAWGATSAAGLYVAGDGAGIAGARAAEVQGRITGLGMARELGLAGAAVDEEAGKLRRRLAALRSSRPFLDAMYPPPRDASRIGDDVIVCRCEEVTAGTLRALGRQGRGGPDQVKAFSRAGMGPCQGRQCGYTVARILAEVSGQTPRDVGFFRIRPPLRPVTLGELAELSDEAL